MRLEENFQSAEAHTKLISYQFWSTELIRTNVRKLLISIIEPHPGFEADGLFRERRHLFNRRGARHYRESHFTFQHRLSKR
jgi:hypothetical protein